MAVGPGTVSSAGADLFSLFLRSRRIVWVAAAPAAVREPRRTVTRRSRRPLVTGRLCNRADWTVDVVIQTREDACRVGVRWSLCRVRVRGRTSRRPLDLTCERNPGRSTHDERGNRSRYDE